MFTGFGCHDKRFRLCRSRPCEFKLVGSNLVSSNLSNLSMTTCQVCHYFAGSSNVRFRETGKTGIFGGFQCALSTSTGNAATRGFRFGNYTTYETVENSDWNVETVSVFAKRRRRALSHHCLTIARRRFVSFMCCPSLRSPRALLRLRSRLRSQRSDVARRVSTFRVSSVFQLS